MLDRSGGQPLFAAAEKRDGYFRPDPGDAAAVQRALFEIADLVGEFDKPRYVQYRGEICTHSPRRKTSCTRGPDARPPTAIRSPHTRAGTVFVIACESRGSTDSMNN